MVLQRKMYHTLKWIYMMNGRKLFILLCPGYLLYLLTDTRDVF